MRSRRSRWRRSFGRLHPDGQQDRRPLRPQAGLHTQLEELLADQPEEIQEEIVRINTDARPLALQVAVLIALLAALIGLFNSFRMVRLPDPEPSVSGEAMALA